MALKLSPEDVLAEYEKVAYAEDLLAAIDSRIDVALTPEVLSKLAFRGVTPEQARRHLRLSAIKALMEVEE